MNVIIAGHHVQDDRWFSQVNRNSLRLYDIATRPSRSFLPIRLSPVTPRVYRGDDPETITYDCKVESRYLWPDKLVSSLASDMTGLRLQGLFYHPKEIRLNLGVVHLNVSLLISPFSIIIFLVDGVH